MRIPFFPLCLIALTFFQIVPSEAATLTGTFANVTTGSNINLTAEGKLDWIHWGLKSDSSLDRKFTVTPQINDLSPFVVSNNYNDTFIYQYSDNANSYSWADGTPVLATNTTTGVWAYNLDPVDCGFLLSVPADTTTKTFKIYVGAFDAFGRLEAWLSDGSASGYTNSNALANAGNGPGGVYMLNFAAASSNQTLWVKWVVASRLGPNANVTLQAATLTTNGADNPPYVWLTNPAPYQNFSLGTPIALSANAADADGTVTNVEFFSGATKLGQVASAPYNFTWNNAPVGLHAVTAHVTDNLGRSSVSSVRNIFVNTNGGSLIGSVTTPGASVDLTANETRDWAHWGLLSTNSFDHKAGVVQSISDLARIGTNDLGWATDYSTAFSWSDGIPTVSASSSPTAIYVTGFENGFELTAPADLIARTLQIYVGLYGGRGNLFAWLSDASASSYNDSSLNNDYGTTYALYTLNYAAASSGKILHVRFTTSDIFDMDFGNVAIASATLVGGPNPLQLFAPELAPAGFSFSFATDSYRTYDAQFCSSITGTNWQTFTNLSGSGAIVRVTNTNPIAGECFYRVIAQP